MNLSKFVYKWRINALPSNFDSWFKYLSQVHSYNIRGIYVNIDEISHDSLKLYIPSARTTNYGTKKIKIQAPTFWNCIPHEVRLKQSLFQFNKALKNHFLSTYQA